MATCPTVDPAKPLTPAPIPSIVFTLRDGSNSIDYKIPWPTFASGSSVAPGGNRYFQETFNANLHDPLVYRAILGCMAISKKHFANYFGEGQDHANMTMSEVLSTYKGKLDTHYGVVQNQKLTSTASGTILGMPVSQIPSEKASDFVKRGGYLLWTDPDTGVFTGNQTIQTVGVMPWITAAQVTGVKQFDLYVKYIPSSATINFVTRLSYDSSLQQTVDNIGDAFQKAMVQVCSWLTADKLQTAAAYSSVASADPHVAAAVAGYQLAANACNKAFPKCTPAVPAVPGPVAVTYPAGTIAWFDKKTSQFHIAVPGVLAGVAATYHEVGTAPTLPAGVAPVTYWAWQSVTRPLYARTSFAIGLAATVALGLGVLVIRKRSHRS